MNIELKKILDQKIRQKTPGTFHLGSGRAARKVLFDGEFFQFADGQSPLHYPASDLWQEHLAVDRLDSLLARWYSETRDIELLLSPVEELDPAIRTEICLNQACWVLVDTFLSCGEVFLFEEAARESIEFSKGIHSKPMLSELTQQLELVETALSILPSEQELLLLSPLGVKARDEHHCWIFSRIGMLIDGFRTIREIEADSPFSWTWTRHHLAEAARSGWVLKKKFPELSRVQLDQLDASARSELLEQLEQATPMAVEPVKILDRLRRLHRVSGDQDAIRSVEIRLVDAHRAAREPESAIAILDHLLAEKPEDEEASEIRIEILVERADQLLAGSQPEEGRRYLRRAIEVSDDDQLRLRLIASHDNPTMQIREGLRIASLLHRNSHRNRSLRLVDSLEALHPESEEMQQARIDFLLDHGEEQASEAALERLAARQAAEGNILRARQIADSVRKLRRKRGVEDQQSIKGRVALGRIRQFCMLAPFIAIAIILSVAEFSLQGVIASAETLPPEQWRQQARPWLQWLPPGPWKEGIESAAVLVDERSKDSQRNYASAAQDALQDARGARLLGNHLQARQKLETAIQFGAAAQAKQLLANWRQQDRDAAELRILVEKARDMTDLPAVRRWSLLLLEQFPSNDATMGLTIPVRIESGAQTRMVTESGELIDLPTWIEIPPFGSRMVTLDLGGRLSEYVITAQGPESIVLPRP
ncbi:MAG: hypothetical protein VX949_11865 [Planctomycetota bacterium]|nr:hypothetical protein [Planctomycetota bacterium]